jgi:hypothetical protein
MRVAVWAHMHGFTVETVLGVRGLQRGQCFCDIPFHFDVSRKELQPTGKAAEKGKESKTWAGLTGTCAQVQ